MRIGGVALLVASALTIASCSGDDSGDEDPRGTAVWSGPTTPDADVGASRTVLAPPTTVVPTTTAEAPPDVAVAIEDVASSAPDGCDLVDTRHCYLPFPSDALTVDDPSTPTGRRVALPPNGAPTNADGVAMDMAEWNRNDGFSPAPTILTHVGDLDLEASDLPSWTDLGASLDEDASVVLVDVTDGGTRIPLWAELDITGDDPDDQLLAINPAVALTEGHTYAVAVRDVVLSDGSELPVNPVFEAYRDGLITDSDVVEGRRPAMDTTLEVLADAGVDRSSLQRAWDFTVASTEGLTDRMLHIRDETLAGLDGAAPEFTVTEQTSAAEDGIALQVRGMYTVPNWLMGDGSPGNGFYYGDSAAGEGPAVPDDLDALPVENGTLEAEFICNIPEATVNGDHPAHLVQYGHGLLGGPDEINAGNVRDFANESNIVFCATHWAGMSEHDVPNAVEALGELTGFSTMADRMQQGFLNQIVLGRLMIGADGLPSHEAFRRDDGTPLIDTDRLTFDGNSQGGIMGLGLAAVSPDIERAVLGVPGMNYSMLLSRSVDWDTYEAIMAPAYDDATERTLLISLIQMLWDPGEGAGYVNHVTSDPLPGTPQTDVLLHVAFGDQQVSELAAMVEARSLGIPVHRPLTDRMQEVEPGWGLDAIDYPSDGSGMVIWDSNAPAIPIERSAPRDGEDPHGDPRSSPDARRQKAAFLFEDQLIDVCDGICRADGPN